MEILEHRNSTGVGNGLRQNGLGLGVSGISDISDSHGCGSQSREGALGLETSPERMEGLGIQERREKAGSLEVYHKGESTEEQASSVVVTDALRCQVKITTRRSLHLRVANHTARDVYVRLVGHGGRFTETGMGHHNDTLLIRIIL